MQMESAQAGEIVGLLSTYKGGIKAKTHAGRVCETIELDRAMRHDEPDRTMRNDGRFMGNWIVQGVIFKQDVGLRPGLKAD